MSLNLILPLLLLLLLLIILPFCFTRSKNIKGLFFISYVINILLFLVIVVILLFNHIRNHYEKENICMITNKLILLIEQKKYDYVLDTLKKSQKNRHEASDEQLIKMRSEL